MPWTLAQAVELQRAVQALGLQEGEVPEWKAVGKLLHPPREARSCWIKYGNIVRNNGGQGAAGETKASGAGRFGGGRGSAGGHDEDEDDGQLEDDDSESDEVPRGKLSDVQDSLTSR